MTSIQMIEKILQEIKTKGIRAGDDYIPSSAHYIPIRYVKYYLKLAYGIGFDEGWKKFNEVNGSKSIIQKLKGVEINKWNSATEAARTLKIERTGIVHALQKRKKVYKGFEWEYYKL